MSIFDRIELADLRVFLTIMRTGSFKGAAIQLGLTPSAVSHAMRRLEERLGAKLLNRSSRAVAPTDTGRSLAQRLEEGFDKIGLALAELDAPGAGRYGELRINVFADAAHLLINPAIPEFARLCPEVRLTVVVEDRPIDIVAEGYDAGVRYGHYVPEDMISVPLSGPQRWVVAAAPAYLARRGEPLQPGDLAQHTCLRHSVWNGRTGWPLREDGVAVDWPEQSRFTCNQGDSLRTATSTPSPTRSTRLSLSCSSTRTCGLCSRKSATSGATTWLPSVVGALTRSRPCGAARLRSTADSAQRTCSSTRLQSS